jgi:uncharacterized protein
MNRIIHFEIPSADLATSRKFYEYVFGWKFTRYDGRTEYWLVNTGPTDTPGINGGLGGVANDFKATVNTVGVDNMEESIKKVESNGGQVVYPVSEIPGMGRLAYIREPGGAVVGLFQTLPGAQM